MKCNQCGSEWSVNKSLSIKITKCPFCNSTIRPEVYSVKDGLRWIVDTRSIDVFLDENIISAILLDTVKGQEKDLKNLKLALYGGVGREFHRILKRCNGKLYGNDIKELVRYIEDLGFTKNFVSDILKTLLYSVSNSIIDSTCGLIESENMTDYIDPHIFQDNSSMDANDYYKSGLEYYKKENFEDALKMFKIAAKLGNIYCCIFIGDMYFSGNGVEKDLKEAYSWFKVAADEGSPEAQCLLGYLYECGYYVKKDCNEAERLYRLSAEQKCVISETFLGLMYYNKHDYFNAVNHFITAVWRRYSIAQFFLGKMYQLGEFDDDHETDPKRAYRLYLESAEKGLGCSQNELAYMCHFDLGYTDSAKKWWERANSNDIPGIYFEIGYIYQYGIGVEQNIDEAMKWYNTVNRSNRPKSIFESISQHTIGVYFDYLINNQNIPWK